MPEHNFEEQASRAMEHFRVEPSAAVWTQLESRLKAARRKRRAFYLFTIIALLAGLGILQWNRQDSISADAALESQTEVADPAVANPEISLAEKSATNPSEAASSASAGSVPAASPSKPQTSTVKSDASGKKPNADLNGAMALRASKENNRNRPVRERDVVQEESGRVETSVEVRQAEKPAVVLTAQEPLDEATREAGTYHLAQLDHLVMPHSIPAATGILAVPNNRMHLMATDSLMAAGKEMTDKDTRNKKVLEFGLSASVGRSAFTEGIGFAMKASADLSVNQPGSAPQPQPIPYDYRHDPSIGFSAGAWMGLPISKRWNFRVGLQYQQFITISPVGTRVDSNRNFTGTQGTLDAQNYYRTGTGSSFTNCFHLLQLPLNFAWKLNPRSSLPMSWSIGLSPGWLVASNALVYDGNNALYHGKENQQGFQLGMQTGFQFHMFQKSARPLQLGPLFQYQFNQAFKEGVQGNGHLYYLGLEASMPIFRRNMKQRSR